MQKDALRAFGLGLALLVAQLGHGPARAEPTPAAATPAAVKTFLSDPEICAFMVSPPDGESDRLIARYEAALRDAVLALRAQDASLSETGALFALRSRCDLALEEVDGQRAGSE